MIVAALFEVAVAFGGGAEVAVASGGGAEEGCVASYLPQFINSRKRGVHCYYAHDTE